MNMASVRPILVSIPHASARIPDEIKDQVALTPKEILHYTDLYTDQIYTIPNVHIVQADVSRVFVDVNRAPDDIAKEYEKSEEGVSVLTTWDGKKVYAMQPGESQADTLIERYHDPFHQKIEEKMPIVQFLFDGHSYLPIGPKLKPDSGKPRPDINIGNINYSTCTREQTVFVRDFFTERGYTVAINFPYAGKYILGHHCHRRRIPPFLVPGMQLEMNQGLYVDQQTLEPIANRVVELRTVFSDMVDAFAEKFIRE
ncbi:MAG: N-formylglutamate amidohydrolase [Candidatus Peribacteraceae bacterium]